MRHNVIDYYENHLNPRKFISDIESRKESGLTVLMITDRNTRKNAARAEQEFNTYHWKTNDRKQPMGPTLALFQNIESHTDTGPCNSCNAPWHMKKHGHGNRKTG